MKDLHYLGPLRAYPSAIYARSGAQPLDMGVAGESVVDAILSYRERGQKIWSGVHSRALAIDEYIANVLGILE